MINEVEVLANRLYWVSGLNPPRWPNCFVFCVDDDLVYDPFNKDFGPLNLSMTYRYCTQLERLMEDSRYKYQLIVHYCSQDKAKQANAAYLMGAYEVLVLERSVNEVCEAFEAAVELAPFRDAGFGSCSYDCTIKHCLGGLERAAKLGWFSLNQFNCRDYEHLERVENGDINWIIPKKFLAFSSPSDSPDSDCVSLTPREFVPVFKQLGVGCVVRLNTSTYDPSPFHREGIKHFDLYYVDGSVPSDDIVSQFLEIARAEPGVIAVHCKAGLGRTGTLIGCYAISMKMIGAEEFIAWARICRPGSVLGPQQKFLLDYENRMSRGMNPAKQIPTTPEDGFKAKYGDYGQGQRLISAKRLNQSASTTPVKSRPSTQRAKLKEATTLNCRESITEVCTRFYTKTEPHRRAESGSYRSPYSFVTRS